MPRFLVLVLEAPLLAFGCEAVDARGPISDFPSASMLTGLLANALGWRRGERERHARLQQRLRFAARIDREGHRLTDFQTVQLGFADRAWTTRGAPEGRAGGVGTYDSPYIRERDYDADKVVTVVLCLDPPDGSPALDEVAAALQTPARPLFLGRKSCLPSRPIFEAAIEADDLAGALAGRPPAGSEPRVLLEASVPAKPDDEVILLSDLRNWDTGFHGGQRAMRVRVLREEDGA